MNKLGYYQTFFIETEIGLCGFTLLNQEQKVFLLSSSLPMKNRIDLEKNLSLSNSLVLGKSEPLYQNVTLLKRGEKENLKGLATFLKKGQVISNHFRKALRGEKSSFNYLHSLPLFLHYLEKRRPFFCKVYLYIQKCVQVGVTKSYKEVWDSMMEKESLQSGGGGQRAIGQAMASNPFPFIVPCHRILGAKQKLVGFSAFEGINLKHKLLVLEGLKE